MIEQKQVSLLRNNMSNKAKDRGILLDTGTNEVEFLLVTLGQQIYGINVSKVCTLQVFDQSKVSPLPAQPSQVLGLMPFRDKTISIIDLSIALNWPKTNTDSKRLLVVAEFNQRVTGFVVDEVDRIERYAWTQFEPITDTTCNTAHASVLGTVKGEKGLIIILDLETIVAALDPSMSIESYAESIEAPTILRNNVNIVHCDDSTTIQKIVLKVLNEAGFSSVKQFANGEEALTYLQDNQGKGVDIVLSDIEMPRMDGLSFCKTMRSDPNCKHIPLVFFSSLITEQMNVKCRSVGGNAAYSKPQINYLVHEIERLVAANQAHA